MQTFIPVEAKHFLPTPQDCGKAPSASPVNWTNPSEIIAGTGQGAVDNETAVVQV